MAAETENGRLSDTEGGEKPVREQLKKAHITTNPNAPLAAEANVQQPAENENGAGEGTAARGRLQRKRSFEEVEDSSHDVTSDPPQNHARKRSRDSTLEENALNNGQRKVSGDRASNGDKSTPVGIDSTANDASAITRASTPDINGQHESAAAGEALSSPKIKRSRLHSTTTDADAALPQGILTDPQTSTVSETAVEPSSNNVHDKPEQPTAKIPPGSGFANTSAASPFSGLAGSVSPPGSQTPLSAFAGSGFSKSAAGGFGALGKSSGGFGSGGSFASGAKSPVGENQRPPTSPSVFGGSLGQQSAFAAARTASAGFGSSSSGFGKLGSTSGGFGGGIAGTGFGSLGGGGLNSFASGKPTAFGKPARTFGAPVDDEDEADAAEDDDDDKAGAKSPLASEEEKQDERFYEQELETGEEDEVTQFSCRAKLYNFISVADGKKEWRERGLGVLRFNTRKASANEDGKKISGRLLMRADGSHRVVLNTPVTKDLKFGAPAGGPPEGGYMYFMGTFADSEKGGLEMLQVKMKQANALELHSHIVEFQEDLI